MISLTFFEFLLLCLASFRLTRLIVFDTITAFIRKPFHDIIEEKNDEGTVETFLHVKGTGFKYWIGELLSCYWCVGVWVSLTLFFFAQIYPLIASYLILILAIAAVSSLIEVFVNKFV